MFYKNKFLINGGSNSLSTKKTDTIISASETPKTDSALSLADTPKNIYRKKIIKKKF